MYQTLYYLLSALGGYVLSSYYLFKNPQVLHKKKHLAFHCHHISHRGGAGEKIENTLEAFRHAVQNKTDLLELDVHLTKDGKVVVSHDENLERQTGVNKNISDINYRDLPPYKERLEVTFMKGHFSTGTDHQISLLENVFREFPRTPVNLEIKEDNDPLIKKVSELVKRYNRSNITVWASTKNAIMDKCIAENPDMPVMFTVKRGLLLLALYYSGLLPFVPLRESVLESPMPSVYNRTYDPPPGLMRNKLVMKLVQKLTMRRSLFQHLEARGIQVYLWVLNQDSDFQKAFSLGATGVITDYPSKLRMFLDNQSS
ncbi:lysophospholipase D GDPD3 [Protopterus annectens]|uniref:lysophospholipase D GDPD3 n=1 Tax=Protopterus annectens TaxID=7888 RepID=UPI001CFB1E21|nr:lysophospholipase D GDPD3 [Protopterus annectens]